LLFGLLPATFSPPAAQAVISAAPTGLSARAGNTYLEISFTAPSGTPTNYDYSIDDGLTWSTRNPAGTWSPLTIYGLTNGTSYNVKIRARDADGPGPASATTTATPTNQTQLVGSQAFIQGAHAEVGIRANGAFGSSSSPSTFHSSGGCLGFRADRQTNGWGTTTGSSPNYTNGNIDDGDFFCPGSPFEGWAIKANGASTSFSDNSGGGPSGSFSTPVNTSTESSVTWTSTTSAYQGLTISQKSSIPTTGQLLNVDVTIKNDSGSTVNNLYYVRNFDPDNGSYPTDPFTTVNTILKNGVDGTGVNIRSTWPNGAAIFLQTNDSRGRGAIHTSGLGPNPDPLALYAGTSPWTRNNSTADVGTGISFNLGSLAAGASTTLRVTYNLTASSASSPSVTTSAASNVGVGTTATLNGVVNANGFASTVTFKYGLNSDLSGATTVNATPSTVSGSTNENVSLNLTGLTAGSTYYFQVISANANGTSAGSILSFTPIASPTVVNRAVSNLANTTVTLNGSINPGGGTATSAKFVYSTVATVDASTTNSTLSTSGMTGTSPILVSGNLTGLSEGTIYFYYLEATTQAGTVRSEILTFTTTPAPAATTSAASSVSATSARLNGAVNANNWNTTSIYFTYGTNSALSDGTTITTTPTQATGNSSTSVYADLSGLTTGVTYYYRLTAVNVNGTNSGSILSFTPAAKPLVTTGTATNSGLRVTFPGVVNANGDATTSIRIIYGTTNDLSSSTATLVPTPSAAAGATDVNVSASPSGSLLPSTVYYYQVVATNSFGSTSGEIRSITTPAAVIVGPSVTITSSSATVGLTSTFTLTITFSAAVSSFTKSMLTSSLQSGWAMADAVQTSATTYTIDVIPAIGASSTGNLTFSMAANATTDTFGNGNTATSATTTVTALPAGLTPTFSTPVATADGFTVNVTNYNSPTYTQTASVSTGTISVGTPTGSIWPLTISGLSSGASAVVTVTTSRSGYSNGTASVTGTTILPGRLAVFDTPVRTSTGFTVNQTNYDATFTQTEAVSVGVLTRGTILGSVLPLTITGLSAGETATVTAVIEKTGYLTGSSSVDGRALQDQTITFSSISSKTYGDAPQTLTATGGASLNPVVFTVGTPAVCSATGSNGTTLTILSSGSCTVRADQSGTATFAAAPRVEQTFTIAQKPLSISAVNVGIIYGGVVTPSYSIAGLSYTDTVTALSYTYSGTLTSTPPTGSGTYSITPSAAVFSPTLASSNYLITYNPGTLVITPNSISGLDPSKLTRLGTITASDSVDSNFSAVAGSSSVVISVPRGTLPSGSVVEAYDYSDTSTARAVLTNAGEFILQAVIAWSAPDGTTPLTNPGKSVQVTVTSPEISAGQRVYSIIGGVATVVGIATVDGTATFYLTEDPVVVITPTVPDAPTSVSAVTTNSQTATISWVAPAINGGSAITGYTATSNSGQACTTSNLSCVIAGLTNGIPHTFTVVAANAIGNSESSTATAAVTPLGSALTPTFSTPVGVSGGFTLSITNYDPAFSWSISASTGTVTIGTPVGALLPLTVSGLAGAANSVISASSSRTGYSNGTATTSGLSLSVFVVTFDSTTNGGSAVSPASVNFTTGDSPIILGSPTPRSGFTFLGWFTGCSGGSSVNSPYLPTASITLCAQWSSQTQSGSSSSPAPVTSAGGGGTPTPTFIYLISTDPSDPIKIYSKPVCVEIFSLSSLKLGSSCSDSNGHLSLQIESGKVALRVFEKELPESYREYFAEVVGARILLQNGIIFSGTNRYAVSAPLRKESQITPEVPVNLGPFLEAATLKDGADLIRIGGETYPIKFSANLSGESYVASTKDWRLELFSLDSNKKIVSLNSQSRVTIYEDGYLRVTGKGFLPNSKYRIYILADETLIAESETDALGDFDSTLGLPSTIKIGSNVLQINIQLINKSVLSSSLELTILENLVAVKPPSVPVKPPSVPVKPSVKKKLSVVIPFAYAKTEFLKQQTALLKTLDLTGKVLRISVTGYAQKSGTDDLKFSLERAAAAKRAILKLAPKAQVTIRGLGSKTTSLCKSSVNRCVIVKISRG